MTNHTGQAGGVTIHDRRPAHWHEMGLTEVAVPPLVIVPGLGMSHRYSKRLHHILGETRPALSLDIPGFGGAPPPRRRLLVSDYAHFIGRALDNRGVTGAVLIGHSMGAQFTAEIAASRPDLVSSLVLASPVVDPTRRTAHQHIIAMARDLLAEPPNATATVIGDFIRTGPRFFLSEMRSMLAYDTVAAVAASDCPVLILRGEHDPIAQRARCKDLASAAAGGIAEISDAGHLVQHTQPESVARAITDFATRLGAAP